MNKLTIISGKTPCLENNNHLSPQEEKEGIKKETQDLSAFIKEKADYCEFFFPIPNDFRDEIKTQPIAFRKKKSEGKTTQYSNSSYLGLASSTPTCSTSSMDVELNDQTFQKNISLNSLSPDEEIKKNFILVSVPKKFNEFYLPSITLKKSSIHDKVDGIKIEEETHIENIKIESDDRTVKTETAFSEVTQMDSAFCTFKSSPQHFLGTPIKKEDMTHDINKNQYLIEKRKNKRCLGSSETLKKRKKATESLEFCHSEKLLHPNQPIIFSAEDEINTKGRNHFNIANFYRHKIAQILEKTSDGTDKSLISQGRYDYRLVQAKYAASKCDQIIEFTDAHLLSFDNSLIEIESTRYLSSFRKHKDFQEPFKERVDNEVRGKFFENLVRLSIGEEIPEIGKSYHLWKKSVEKEITSLANDIKCSVFEKNSSTKIRVDLFVRRYSRFFFRRLIREIMRHALLHIPLIPGHLLISRAGIAPFLNQYSEYFLKKFTESERTKECFLRGSGSSYFSWKKSKIEPLDRIKKENNPQIKEIIALDFDSIREKVLVLDEKGYFRHTSENEFQKLVEVIHQLLEIDGPSNFIERAARHFHKEAHHEKVFSKKINVFTDDKTGIEQRSNKKGFFSEGSKNQRNQVELDGPSTSWKEETITERATNRFKVADIYRQIIRQELQDTEKEDTDSFISCGQYDYRRVQYKNNTPLSSRGNDELGIEVANTDLSVLGSTGIASPPSLPNACSRERKEFQKSLRKKIEKDIKHELFLSFVRLSLVKESKDKPISYISWKESLYEKLSSISESVRKKVLREEKIEVNEFVTRSLLFQTDMLVKEILRHALFSLHTAKEKTQKPILISRAGMAKFFNRYSEYFLLELLKPNNRKELARSIRYSYVFWKKSKGGKIGEIISNKKEEFKNLLDQDKSKIRQEVLVLDKDRFRALTDDEFKKLLRFILLLGESDGSSGFIERATQHFYKEEFRMIQELRHSRQKFIE